MERPVDRPNMQQIKDGLEKLIDKYCEKASMMAMPTTRRKKVTSSTVNARELIAQRQKGSLKAAESNPYGRASGNASNDAFVEPAQTGRPRLGHDIRMSGVDNYRDLPGRSPSASGSAGGGTSS